MAVKTYLLVLDSIPDNAVKYTDKSLVYKVYEIEQFTPSTKLGYDKHTLLRKNNTISFSFINRDDALEVSKLKYRMFLCVVKYWDDVNQEFVFIDNTIDSVDGSTLKFEFGYYTTSDKTKSKNPLNYLVAPYLRDDKLNKLLE